MRAARIEQGLMALGVLLCGCAAAPEGPVSLLFEGDSDIEGWDTSGYPDSANVGVGGAVCADVLETIADTLEAYKPGRVVLVCGENDLWEQSVSRTFDDFSAVVSRINRSGATVYYMGTKPEPATTPLHGEYREYDALIREHAENLAGSGQASLVMIDVYRGFEAVGNPRSLYQGDKLHLSQEGYALWDEWLTAAFTDERCIIWESGACQSALSER